MCFHLKSGSPLGARALPQLGFLLVRAVRAHPPPAWFPAGRSGKPCFVRREEVWREEVLGSRSSGNPRTSSRATCSVLLPAGQVKEYAGEELMVIKMDIAGTMSCPLDRLESLKAKKRRRTGGQLTSSQFWV